MIPFESLSLFLVDLPLSDGSKDVDVASTRVSDLIDADSDQNRHQRDEGGMI